MGHSARIFLVLHVEPHDLKSSSSTENSQLNLWPSKWGWNE